MSSEHAVASQMTCVGTINRNFQGWIDWGNTAFCMPRDGTMVYVSNEAADPEMKCVRNPSVSPVQKSIEEAVSALANHPDVHKGNSIVHYVYHKLRGLTTFDSMSN